MRAKDKDHAIELPNDTRFGFGASIWTQDIERGKKAAERIESRMTYINGVVKFDPRVPFGGIKASGYNRELVYLGIREFVNPKTAWVEQ